MKKVKFTFAILLIYLAGCQSPKQEDKFPMPQTYHSPQIGWTITIPEGFAVLSKNRLEAKEARDRAALGADSGKNVSADALKNLVNFQKNQFNLFSATLQRFPEKEQKFLDNQQALKKLIYEAYAKQKIKVDSSSGKAAIAGRTFQVFYLKIYGPDGSILMTQELYSALINGHDLSININYNNEADHEILLSAFRKSTFAKPKN